MHHDHYLCRLVTVTEDYVIYFWKLIKKIIMSNYKLRSLYGTSLEMRSEDLKIIKKM